MLFELVEFYLQSGLEMAVDHDNREESMHIHFSGFLGDRAL